MAAGGACDAGCPGPLPRWYWLLPLWVLTLLWPRDPAWQSDDFLALHYAADWRRCLADFVGPQYAATDLWLFYRPLITLSFWVDLQLGGSEPFQAHLHNVLAHAANALLGALLWRRFTSDGKAALLALWWALLPGHAGSIAWAVGRVDSYTTCAILLALWLAVRRHERLARGEAASAAPMLAAATVALLCKELAIVVAPLATAVVCLHPGMAQHAGSQAGISPRLRAALRQTWPLWLLLLVYLGFRLLVLGRFGGYLGASYAPLAMLQGLVAITANLLVPLRHFGQDLVTGTTGWSAAVVLAFASLPVGLALLWQWRQPQRLLAVLLVYGIALGPMAAFVADGNHVHSLRYYYLPSLCLAGLWAMAPHWLLALAIAAVLPAFAAQRQTQLAADQQSGAAHRDLLAQVPAGKPPWFVAGLPHANADGSVVQLHFGIDRMLEPPFGPGGIALYAHRPLAEVPGVVRLVPPGTLPWSLPQGSTLQWSAAGLQRSAATEPLLPDLPLVGDDDGEVDCSTERLWAMTAAAPRLFAERLPSFGLRTPGVKPTGPLAGYRVTIFTANGYLGCLCGDYGLGGEQDGWIDLLRFLARDEQLGVAPGVTALQGTAFAGEGLMVPTILDLDPVFPVLVEAGRLDAGRGEFVPSHRARRLLRWRFDRGYPGWVRAVQGRG
jgi:hypothetical protein